MDWGVARTASSDYLCAKRKVKFVADASIQPDDSATIIIEKDAVMRPLENATVVANTSTRYHRMIESHIQISGRKSYSGTGKYAYTDQAGVKNRSGFERTST